MILGLDISTSTTGYCIFNEDGVKHIGYICLRKHKDIFKKSAEIKRAMQDIKEKYDIKEIAVEQNLQAFRPGLSSAATLMKLAQFNGIVQWICFEVFNIPAISFNVNTARKTVGLKVKRKDVLSTKEQVLQWVQGQEPDVQWPVKLVTRGRNKGQTKHVPECYDMADAYVIAKASYLLAST
jgi:Holliday junction resolvasome RuvABC endonuclease subunit